MSVHGSHCCPIHGCKYGDDDCPVEAGTEAPEYECNNGCEICEGAWWNQAGSKYENLREHIDHLLEDKQNLPEKLREALKEAHYRLTVEIQK